MELNGIGLRIGRLGRNWDCGKPKTWASMAAKGIRIDAVGTWPGDCKQPRNIYNLCRFVYFGAGEKGGGARVLREKAMC